MPKEYINDSCGHEERIKVGWNREANYIQLATVGLEPPESSGIGDGDEGWYVQLDRDGCNKLIRAVRRARDQAFGRDE